MSTESKNAGIRDNLAEWLIITVLLVVMAGALYLASDWPANAAFFPRLLSGIGLFLIILRIVMMVMQIVAPAPAAIEAHMADTDDDGDADDLHEIFQAAKGKNWRETLLWLGAFFVGLWAVGLVPVLVVFTMLYLKFVAKISWLNASIYTVVMAGFIYLLFVRFLYLPLPAGALINIRL